MASEYARVNAMASQSIYQEAIGQVQTPTLKSCLNDFDEQLSRLQSVLQGATRMADFISGGQPSAGEAKGPAPVPNGYVVELRDRLRTLSGLISAIGEQQGRAEANATG